MNLSNQNNNSNLFKGNDNLNQDELNNKENTNPFPSHTNQNVGNNNSLVYNYIKPKFLYELNGAHTSTVNIIRFSPNGLYLASGGDDSAIVIWVQKSRPIEFGSKKEKIIWSNYKIMRGHLSDIYDIAWSPDSKYLISGSVDNRALIWSLEKGKVIDRSIDHTHFVQGVSWDPKNMYVTTQSSDKSAKILCNANIKNEIKFYPNFLIKKYNKTNFSNLEQNLRNDKNTEENQNNDRMEIDQDENNSGTNSNLSNNLNALVNLTNKKEKNNRKEKNINCVNNLHYFSDEMQCTS